MKFQDRLPLLGCQPMVARDPTVMLVDFAVASLPVVEFARLNSEPGNDAFGGNAGAILPVTNVIDNRVAGVVGNPASV